MTGKTARQILAFGVIFAGLTIGFELFRNRPLTWGTGLAILLAWAVYATIILVLERRKGGDD